jgi:hypothetical protein
LAKYELCTAYTGITTNDTFNMALMCLCNLYDAALCCASVRCATLCCASVCGPEAVLPELLLADVRTAPCSRKSKLHPSVLMCICLKPGCACHASVHLWDAARRNQNCLEDGAKRGGG